MNNIAFGQYIKGNSWMHKLDPRVKLLILIVYLVALFIIPISTNTLNLFLIGSLFLIVFLVYLTCKIPLIKIINSIKGIVFLILITIFFQIIAIKEGTVIFEGDFFLSLTSILAIIAIFVLYNYLKKIIKFKTILLILVFAGVFVLQYYLPYVNFVSYHLEIRSDALLRALFLFIRIIAIILSTSLLTYTTMTNDFSSSIDSLLYPLKLIKIPVSIFSMIMSLTLRSIPILFEESQKIIKAQASRGSDLKESNIIKKITQVVSFMIPILIVSFQKAFDLADAMEVRGYVVGAKRTSIDTKKLKVSDILILISSFLLLTGIILFVVLL